MSSKVLFIRHGKTDYTKPAVIDYEKNGYSTDEFETLFGSLEDIQDDSLVELTEYYQQYIESNLEYLKSKSKIHFWVSPYARTTHTAMIFLKQLSNYGIDVEKIFLFNKLGEVLNFKWNVFISLIKGLEINVNGKSVKLDVTKTNPKGLNSSDYFFESFWLQIDNQYLLDNGIYEIVKGIESYQSVKNRSKSSISKVMNMVGNDKLVVMFSHMAISDRLFKEKENYVNGGQMPGDILELSATNEFNRIVKGKIEG